MMIIKKEVGANFFLENLVAKILIAQQHHEGEKQPINHYKPSTEFYKENLQISTQLLGFLFQHPFT